MDFMLGLLSGIVLTVVLLVVMSALMISKGDDDNGK